MSLWDGDLGRLFLLLECGFLGEMASMEVLVLVETVDVVQGGFFCLFQV